MIDRTRLNMLRIKTAKLALIAFSAVITYLCLRGERAGTILAEDQAREAGQIDVVGRGASMAVRVGADDGAAFVVHFSGDMHGNLDSCG